MSSNSSWKYIILGEKVSFTLYVLDDNLTMIQYVLNHLLFKNMEVLCVVIHGKQHFNQIKAMFETMSYFSRT